MLGLPTISISFKSAAQSALKRGERGVVAILARDATHEGVYPMRVASDIPAWAKAVEALNAAVENAFIGNVNPPKKVVLVVAPSTEVDIVENLARLYSIAFDYGCAAFTLTSDDIGDIKDWVDEQRASGKRVKFVVPNAPAGQDTEGLVNLAMDSITVGGVAGTSDGYCARIAGLLAGTPLTMSATYSVLPEVEAVTPMTKTELDAAIGAGEFVLFHDGEKVKVARAVNTFTTVTEDKTEVWSKCKIVDILDLIYTDVRRSLEDTYIGKYSNSYDNKLLVVLAINEYFKRLTVEGLLDKNGTNKAAIDVEAQRDALRAAGIVTDDMTDVEVMQANTGDDLFLLLNVRPLDAIEDVAVKVIL